jgi:mono/diheme cytochrome c family protein
MSALFARAAMRLSRIALRSNLPMARRLMVLSLAAGITTGAYADDSAFTSTAGMGDTSGADIYTHICQGCHMAQGQGAAGAGHYPKLAGDPALVSWQYVALTVLNGKNGMPAFGLPDSQVLETRSAHLSDAQVAAVVNYVRTHFGNKSKAIATADQVAALPHPPATGR